MKFQKTLDLKFRRGTIKQISSQAFKYLFIFLLGFVVINTLSAQPSRTALEREREQLIAKIAKTNQKISSTKKEKASATTEVDALALRISERQALIDNFTAAIDSTDHAIEVLILKMDLLVNKLNRIEAEYAQMAREAYRIKLTNSWLAFLLSAEDINDAFKRWRYLSQFENSRKRERSQLLNLAAELEIQKIALEREKAEKASLFQQLDQQNQILEAELSRKEQMVKRLSVTERRLMSNLEKQRAAQRKLDTAIERMISGVADIKAPSKSLDNESIDFSKLDPTSLTFYQKRGKLAWPIADARVVKTFGRQPHPSVQNIQINNNGIDLLSTNKSTDIKVVADGKVVGTQFVPGFKHTVIVQHGIFYTVYSNLEEIFVQRETIVNGGSVIGKANGANPILHFELWQHKTRINPLNWLQ